MLIPLPKTFYCFFLLFFIGKMLPAQQLPLFTQYRYQHSLLNPATVSIDYARFGNVFSAGAGVRSQWVGQAGTPQTQTLWGEYIIAENGVTGAYIVNDKSGPTSFTGLLGRMAYILSDDPAWSGVAVGFNFGMIQHRLKVSKIILENPQQDILGQQNQSQWFPDIGVGIFAYHTFNKGALRDDVGYIGFSIPQVLGLDLTFREFGSNFQVQRIQHYYLTIGLYKFLGDYTFLEPSAWVKYVPGSPIQADFNLRAHIEEYFWLGVGLSTSGVAHLEAGISLPTANESETRFGYGFDYGFNDYGAFFGSSHEINVMFTY